MLDLAFCTTYEDGVVGLFFRADGTENIKHCGWV